MLSYRLNLNVQRQYSDNNVTANISMDNSGQDYRKVLLYWKTILQSLYHRILTQDKSTWESLVFYHRGFFG